MRTLVLLNAAVFLTACGDDAAAPDAGGVDAQSLDAESFDATPNWAVVGGLQELDMLADYNHAAEPHLVAAGGTVVVAPVHQVLLSEDSFQFPDELPVDLAFRRTPMHVSHDGGETFAPPADLPLAPDRESTDPVLLRAPDGTIWFLGLEFGADPPDGRLFRSTDDGDTFQLVNDQLNWLDKEWGAVGDTGEVFICSANSLEWLDPAGALIDSLSVAEDFMQCTGAYFGADGWPHFMILESGQAYRWEGGTAMVPEGAPLDYGREETVLIPGSSSPDANVWTKGSVGFGEHDGLAWTVYARRESGTGSIRLRTRDALGEETDSEIVDPQLVAFLPAATVDDVGRLHVVYYQSGGPVGQFRYMRSLDADWSLGFEVPIIIDANACPGDGWYPYRAGQEPFGGRRLREYVGIATDGDRVHLAWTHAPDPPSRVWVAYVE